MASGNLVLQKSLTVNLSLQPLAVDVALQVDHVALAQAQLVLELGHEREPGKTSYRKC